jgi:type IV secretion system protein VirB11
MADGDAQLVRWLERIRRDCGDVVMAALKNDRVLEIMANPDGSVWLDIAGEGMVNTGHKLTAAAIDSVLAISASCLKTELTRESPILEGEFPLDGSRLQGLVPPIVAAPSFAIRKKATLIFTLDDYVARGVMTQSQADSIRTAVKNRDNIFIIGGTGSGKTTLANAGLQEVATLCPDDRLVAIEDTNELQVAVRNQVLMRTSETCSITRLLRATMRLRPDRIVVGEVRGKEAYTLLKAWNSGHPGGFATIHANSASEGLDKLAHYIFEAEESRNFSSEAMCRMIAQVVGVVIFIEKTSAAPGRCVRTVGRVRGYSNGSFELDPL